MLTVLEVVGMRKEREEEEDEIGGRRGREVVRGRRGRDEEEKREALLLLTAIVDKGRQCKELLCESYGELPPSHMHMHTLNLGATHRDGSGILGQNFPG